MGIYVEVMLHDRAGTPKIAWMEIVRVEGQQEADSVNTYRFRYRGNDHRGVVGGEVFHRYGDSVFELIRKVLNHSEPQPEYCQSCGCQFTLADEDDAGPLYRRTEVPQWR